MKFSIVSMLLMILAIAILAAFHYQIATFVNRRLLLSASVVCWVSFVVTISVGHRRPPYLLIPAVLAIVAFVYVYFTHERLYAFLDTSFPRPLPYPDMMIDSIIASIPSPEHHPNRTWEAIVETINLGAILIAGMAGTLLGMSFRPDRKSRDNNTMHTTPSKHLR